METRPYVPWDLIENFMKDTFQAVGVPKEDAAICADVLMESDRRGSKVMAATALSRFILTVLKRESKTR